MTVKSSKSFTDHHHHHLKDKVEQGIASSVSSLVAMGEEQLMREEAEQLAMLDGLRDVIAVRMQTLDEAWVTVDESDSVFVEARAQISNKR